MRRFYIGLLCLAAVMCAVFGFLFVRDAFSLHMTKADSASPDSTIDEPISLENEEKQLTVSAGNYAILSISKQAETLLKGWTSSDTSVVTVDSGGRIDALCKGKAVVTASFTDGHVYTYNVTVTQSQESPDLDKFSTAYTANEDIMRRNLAAANEVDLSAIYDPFTAPDESAKKLPFEIHVNRNQNCVTVYTYDEDGNYTVPVRAMICSCGKDNGTITGKFHLYFKSEWHYLYNDVYGRYVSGIEGDFLFHSVPYEEYAFDTLETEEYNKLGSDASLGCVRLAVSDSKWIYDNCAVGTTIKIFDSDDVGPLGRPEAIKITDLKNGWDPTDYNSDNPYNTCYPQILGLQDRTLIVGDSFSPSKGVSALDSCGNDITSEMEIIGNVIPSHAGQYKLTYKVTDVLRRSTAKEITVTVKEKS